MTFLPIVAREMRVAARRRGTYWVRFAAAALAMAICAYSFLFLSSVGMASFAGKMLFGGLIGLIWIYAFLGGVFKTADTISEENREGTLGLLFLTDLKGYDIVLGKIVAASVNWFFGLLALFPVLALSLLMGGVAPGEFWRQILGLTNLLFFSLALGMFVSSFMRNERHAAGLTFALLLVLMFGPSLVIDAYQDWSRSNVEPVWLVLVDVRRPMQYADDYRFGRNPGFYWGSLAVSHSLAWLLLLLASLIVPHTWQIRAGKVSGWQENVEQWTYGKNRARRKRFRLRALDINPFYWVACRARGKSIGVMVALVALVVYCLVSIWRRPNEWHSQWAYLWPAFWLHCIVKIWLALEACRRFVEDRRSGALELILSTPVTPDEILRGQWRALLRQFAIPVLFVLLIDAVSVAAGLAIPKQFGNASDLKEQFLFATMLGSATLIFIADLIALGWLSMWRGMKARHSYTALLWSIVQILAGPWVLFYLLMTGFMMIVFVPQVIRSGNTTSATTTKWLEWMPQIFTGLWFLASMAVAILSAWWARRCLKNNFRYQATLSCQPPKVLWPPAAKSDTLPPRIA